MVDWTGGSGDWSVGTHWSEDHVPYSYETAYITTNVTVTVAHGESEQIATLNLGGGSSSSTLDVVGTLNGGDNLNVLSKGVLNISGTVSNFSTTLNVASGGTMDIQAGGLLAGGTTALTVNGTLNVEGSYTTTSGVLNGSGTINIDGGSLGSVANLASIGSANNHPIFNISGGGSLFLQNPALAKSINFVGPGNSLYIPFNPSGASIDALITGLGTGNVIELSKSGITSITSVQNTNGPYEGNYTITFIVGPGNDPVILNNVELNTGETVSLGTAANGNSELVVTGMGTCFLEGTMIATPSGAVAVDALRVGELVNTVLNGELVAKPVKWLGHRSVKPGDLPKEDAHPVRIKTNAFGNATPQRDLLITPEHCILVDGRLIPARMLVNGRSIIVDQTISSFTYYHVELEEHGILLAEGLTTESYLDTGNRGSFANADVPSLRPRLTVDAGHKNWANAAAPLTVDAASVEPVWQMLNTRAQELGIAKVTADLPLSSDPDLHLVTGSGLAVQPIRSAGDRYFFMVPAGESDLRLVSRTARPSDTIGPFVDDRRELGVLVGGITLHDGRKTTAIGAHLASRALSGWFDIDNSTHRWTRGNANLPINLTKLRGPAAILEIQIVRAGPYLIQKDLSALNIKAA